MGIPNKNIQVCKKGPGSSLSESLITYPFFYYKLSGEIYSFRDEQNNLLDRLDFSATIVRPVAMRTHKLNYFSAETKEIFSMNVPYDKENGWWDFETFRLNNMDDEQFERKFREEVEDFEHNYNMSDIVMPFILNDEFVEGLVEYNFGIEDIRFIKLSSLIKFHLEGDYRVYGKVVFTVNGYALFEKPY